MGFGPWLSGPALEEVLQEADELPKFLDRDHVRVLPPWGMGGGLARTRLHFFNVDAYAGIKMMPVEFDDEPGTHWFVPIRACTLVP